MSHIQSNIDVSAPANVVVGGAVTGSGSGCGRRGFFSIMVAATQKHGIGMGGDLPWKIDADLRFFKEMTSKTIISDKSNAVIMGSKTWASIPAKLRPLKKRINVIVSRIMTPDDVKDAHDTFVVSSFDAALELLDGVEMAARVEQVFCIGGSDMYALALKSPRCNKLYLTRILKEFKCDRFFPMPGDFELDTVGDVQVEDGVPFQFQEWTRRHSEEQYLDLIRNILSNGISKGDRTGTGTISLFAPPPMRFNLRNNVLPLFTTKQVSFRMIFEELRWFCSGSTDTTVLSARKCKIWDDNASRDALDKLGLKERRVGDAGPIYGHQLRHAGATYTTCDANYEGQGFDQLADLLRMLVKEPNSRRLLLDFWDPLQMEKQVLPACHVLAQFDVCNGELSCQMYQRSADVILGVPYNVTSYCLLVRQLCATVGLQPGDFTHVIGNAHIYNDHIEAARVQVTRKPMPFPTLEIKRRVDEIEKYQWEDLELDGYKHHPTLGKLKMSV